MHDFRDIVDHFSTYDAGVTPDGKFRTRASVKGVRISCRGHMEALKIPKYSAVEVAAQDPMFREPHDLCSVALMVDLPIRILRVPPDEAWKEQRRKTNNQDVSDLLLNVNWTTDNDNWGHIPAEWALEGGSALIVRADCEDLLPEHMEALCDFCTDKIKSVIGKRMKRGDEIHGRVTIRKTATQESFQAYFDMYRRRRCRSDARWNTVPSPYDYIPVTVLHSDGV